VDLSEPTAGLGTSGWLSLGPASELLGIDPDTLRRWADEGRVPAWTTPGGHRRFDADALNRLVAARRSTTRMPLTSLGASPERLTRVYQRHYASDERADEAERVAYRRAGRRLITTLVAYLDADPEDSRRRRRLESKAGTVVDDQARRLAESGATLPDAIGRFVGARQPFVAELAAIGRRRSLDPTHLAELYGDAWAVLDRLLLRFIDTYQRET
jgi:excisionase family DNA binding protein